MRVEDFFPPEVIDEDIKKWMSGAVAAGALLGATAGHYHEAGPKVSPRDVAALAQTMWGEARSHGPLGMLAVGFVIKNRAFSGIQRFGTSIQTAALKPKQFSCWNKGDPNRAKMGEMAHLDQIIKSKQPPEGEKSFDDWFAKFKKSPDFNEYQAWTEAFRLARDILNGKASDPTSGAVFYHTTAVHPQWAAHMTPSTKVANHVFYRLPKTQNS